MFLYESALSDSFQDSRYGIHPFGRVNMLYACLTSTRSCFDAAFSFSPLQWFDLPYSTWSLLGHAIVILSRLSLCMAEGWDHELNQNLIDFPGMMDILGQKIQAVIEFVKTGRNQLGPSPLVRIVPDLFLAIPAKLQHVKNCHESKYAAQFGLLDRHQNLQSVETSILPMDVDLEHYSVPPFFEFLQEDFWSHFT